MDTLLKGSKILLVGEVHGTTANVEVLKYLHTILHVQCKSITIALEISKDLGEVVTEFDSDKSKEFIQEIRETEAFQSGRISGYHIAIFKELFRRGVTFLGIREEYPDWNTTDVHMSERIREAAGCSDIVVAFMGNMHARKSGFSADWIPRGYECHPVGELLADQAKSLLIRYCDTEYVNFGKRDGIKDHDCGTAPLLNVKEHESNGRIFDYELFVDGGLAVY